MQLLQPLHVGPDLPARRFVRLEISRVLRQQKAALTDFGIEQESQ